jgi:signal transduction histidine kinase
VQCRGYEGTLLVLVAMQLGLVTTRVQGLTWVALQTLAMAAAIAHHWTPRQALLLAPPYLGFQVLGFLVFELVARETRTRIGLTQANAELVSTRALLAESARLNERLRIGRELHDVMGHHLAALSLNLHAVEPVSPPLETARALTRRLLDDVESVVAALGQERGVDLEQALRALADAIPLPKIHLDAADLALKEPERAYALLRCCQEIVTNAVRHAAAANLWISIRRRDGVFELDARDDGSGAAHTDGGQGLPGIRRRLAEIGGTLQLETRPGAGFHVHATLPCEGKAALADGTA